jgi:hypothetical protein
VLGLLNFVLELCMNSIFQLTQFEAYLRLIMYVKYFLSFIG